jgi:IclR family transcriptional regulator, KDG regulon repressor
VAPPKTRLASAALTSASEPGPATGRTPNINVSSIANDNTPNDNTANDNTAESVVHRALSIVTSFSYAEPVLGISEISRRLDLPKSTVHRLLATLVTEGFVERTHDGRYRLSLKLYEIGQQVVSSHRVRRHAHLPLEKLRNESGEASHLAVLAGADVVYLDRYETPQLMRLFTRSGRRSAAHTTSSGKCLLAFGTQADVDVVIAAGLPKMGPRTITSKSQLTRALVDIRKAGHAISVDETAMGVVSVGAPIFDEVGSCVAAVSIAGPSSRMSSDAVDRGVRLVVKAAAVISRALRDEALAQAPQR